MKSAPQIATHQRRPSTIHGALTNNCSSACWAGEITFDGSAAHAASTGRRRTTISRQTPNTMRNSATASGEASGNPISDPCAASAGDAAAHSGPRGAQDEREQREHIHRRRDRRIRGGVGQARREQADAVRRAVDLVGVFDRRVEHERPDVRSRDVGDRVREGPAVRLLRRGQAVPPFELLTLPLVN